jgi:phospholipid/cholesterol/gamma-HCH transport system permease protein
MAAAALSRVRGWTRTLGEIVQFGFVSVIQIPQSLRYIREVWWYAAFIAIGSTPVALILTMATGAECSVEAYYSLSQIGALTLTGVFNAICDTREITPLFFGFAIGAKVGCGLVAELGTMRVNEEIDALEIMSIPTRVYLVSVRMLACFIVLPFMYLLSLAVSYLGSYLVQHFQIRQVSDGVYFDYFWRFLNTQDLLFSMTKAVVLAKTMATALVMVVVVNAVLTQIFWGNNPNLPIQI